MNLPIYQQINIKSPVLEDVVSLLNRQLNQRRPVAFVLLTLPHDDQREVMGLVENWYVTQNVSWTLPYPVYFVSVLADGFGQIPIVSQLSSLPKFFSRRELKLTSKEAQLLERNRLLQQEICNHDDTAYRASIHEYAVSHRRILALTQENTFYQELLLRLREARHGS